MTRLADASPRLEAIVPPALQAVPSIGEVVEMPTSAPALTPEQQDWLDSVETQAIDNLSELFLKQGVVTHPNPAGLRSVVKTLAKENIPFNRYVTALADGKLGHRSSAPEIEAMVDKLCDVAYPTAYLSGLGKNIINNHGFDNGNRRALIDIRKSLSASGNHHPMYAELDGIITSHIGMAIDREDATALKSLAEVRDILRPDFDHPCNLALSKALDAAVQIIDGKDLPTSTSHKPGRTPVTDYEFSKISSSFDVPVLPEALELVPRTVNNYQAIGAKLANLTERLKAGAPEDSELQDQCDKLKQSLRLNTASSYNDRPARQSPSVSSEPMVAIVKADVDPVTGYIAGGHTDLVPAKEVERRKWTEYVVPLVVSGALLTGGVIGAPRIASHVVSQFDGKETPASNPATNTTNSLQGRQTEGLASADSLDRLTVTPSTPPIETTPVAGAQAEHDGKPGAQQSQEHSHHTQTSANNFNHVGQLPAAGPEASGQNHYIDGGTISAQEAKLDDMLKNGTLNDVVQATIARYGHTTSHGHGFQRPPARYVDRVNTIASRIDRQLKQQLDAKKIDEQTYLEKRAYIADSVAMLMNPGVAAHVHGLADHLPKASNQSINRLNGTDILGDFAHQESFHYVALLMANTLDTLDPPVITTTPTTPNTPTTTNDPPESQPGQTPSGGETTATQLSQSAETIINGLDQLSPGKKQFLETAMAAAVQLRNDGAQINPEVMVAQAIMESGWDQSDLAAKYNNLFGMKAGDSWDGATVTMPTQEQDSQGNSYTVNAVFRAYPNAYASMKDYAYGFIGAYSRYADARSHADNAQDYVDALVRDGYATDHSYANSIMSLVTEYKLTSIVDAANQTTSTEPAPSGGGSTSGSENGVPNDPSTRQHYLANELGIADSAITVSTSYAGIIHFDVDPTVGAQMLGIPAFGGYPEQYRDAAPDAFVDQYGMYSTECVSYAAWRVGHDQFQGTEADFGGKDNVTAISGMQGGTAEYWDDDAKAHGIPVDHTPAQGAVIVWNTNGAEHSSMGHVAYVEKVLADGSVIISQYNNAGTHAFSISILTPQYLDMVKDQIDYIHFEKPATAAYNPRVIVGGAAVSQAEAANQPGLNYLYHRLGSKVVGNSAHGDPKKAQFQPSSTDGAGSGD